MSRHLRHALTWTAALAVLLAALAPAVSQWLLAQHSPGVNWVEVCSASGTRWVAVGEAPADGDSGGAGLHGQSHCPACVLQHLDMDLPPQPAVVAVLPLGPHSVPHLFLHAPRTLAVWDHAQARAPPRQA
jgi:hypothetical protein